MNEQTGATWTAEPADPSIRRRRMDALQRAHRARQILDREAELAARYGDSQRHAEDADGSGAADAGAARDATDEAYRGDVERLLEIHRNLRHERQVARRPFHRHSERLVLALELAERLALDRLGFDDFADFEAHQGEGRPAREIIDLGYLEEAERELAEAEAILAELGGTAPTLPPVVRLPTWTVDPILREPTQVRATRARREVFGIVAPSLFDRPGTTEEIVISDWPLPFRSRSARRSSVAAGRSAEGDVARRDVMLGEIVHNGRTLRVERIGGLVYTDAEDDPSAAGITYGDPNRPD